MIRIVNIDPAPFLRVGYLNARSGGGTEASTLEVSAAEATGLGDEYAGIIVASDLQGMAASLEDGQSVLLGCALADHLVALADADRIPPTSSLGVVLCGDLWSDPRAKKRGGFGDVSEVWRCFAAHFRWVVGVAGNHDGFGSDRNQRRLRGYHNLHVLDGDLVTLDGVTFGGVGLVAGRSNRPGRRSPEHQTAAIQMVLDESPDVLILHEGPSGDPGQRGNDAIRALIERGGPPLTLCGHRHWADPMAYIGSKQILNTDGRALLLRQ